MLTRDERERQLLELAELPEEQKQLDALSRKYLAESGHSVPVGTPSVKTILKYEYDLKSSN